MRDIVGGRLRRRFGIRKHLLGLDKSCGVDLGLNIEMALLKYSVSGLPLPWRSGLRPDYEEFEGWRTADCFPFLSRVWFPFDGFDLRRCRTVPERCGRIELGWGVLGVVLSVRCDGC